MLVLVSSQAVYFLKLSHKERQTSLLREKNMEEKTVMQPYMHSSFLSLNNEMFSLVSL